MQTPVSPDSLVQDTRSALHRLGYLGQPIWGTLVSQPTRSEAEWEIRTGSDSQQAVPRRDSIHSVLHRSSQRASRSLEWRDVCDGSCCAPERSLWAGWGSASQSLEETSGSAVTDCETRLPRDGESTITPRLPQQLRTLPSQRSPKQPRFCCNL